MLKHKEELIVVGISWDFLSLDEFACHLFWVRVLINRNSDSLLILAQSNIYEDQRFVISITFVAGIVLMDFISSLVRLNWARCLYILSKRTRLHQRCWTLVFDWHMLCCYLFGRRRSTLSAYIFAGCCFWTYCTHFCWHGISLFKRRAFFKEGNWSVQLGSNWRRSILRRPFFRGRWIRS